MQLTSISKYDYMLAYSNLLADKLINDNQTNRQRTKLSVTRSEDKMRLLEESQKEILQCLKYPEKLAQIAKES